MLLCPMQRKHRGLRQVWAYLEPEADQPQGDLHADLKAGVLAHQGLELMSQLHMLERERERV